MKTEVYSWRVSTEVKAGLEREARRRNVSLSAVLNEAAGDWLAKSETGEDDGEKQRRLHAAASECFGAFSSGDTRRSQTVRKTVRLRLRRRNA